MKDVTEAFDDYWKTHFENLVLPINQKSEMKKIAFHAYKVGYKSFEREHLTEKSENGDTVSA